jgi:phosphohistidine swiveling domain-containing protein
MRLNLSSKAKTLENLAGVIKSAMVLPQVRFSIEDYTQNSEIILNNCIEKFESDVIVRSSSYAEDTHTTSYAGGFDSFTNVKLNKDDLENVIQRVILSYGTNAKKEDEVFVQPMLKNVSMSGVVFTADLDTLAPYYIVNYDESGSTSTVTGGFGDNLKTVVIFKDYEYQENKKIKLLLRACRECEKIFDTPCLDIEFAFTGDVLYILQVRAIVTLNKETFEDIDFKNSLDKLYKKIIKLNASHPKLLGSRSIFGVMPDWNPAEIIGIKPKRLALSLYKEIITDEIWAYQRDNYGYRNLRSFPLLVSFLGLPYIDVRISFNSFIPKNLHESIATKLVEYYLGELSLNTQHHDKVEFEIVYSCYYFGIDKKLAKLREKNFTDNEIKRIEFELLELTNTIIDTYNGLYKKDLQKVELLKEKYEEIVSSELPIIDKIYWLIEDCKRYGTLPFAGVARAAFIAIQFLNSFVDEGIFSVEEKSKFLNSIETVSKKLNYDKQSLSREDFLKKYGHLRPGTYDICSLRYDEAYAEYFSDFECSIETEYFEFTSIQIKKIEKLIVQNGLKTTFQELIQFIKEAIEGREYTKFIFTKHLSQILSYIEMFGNKLGFCKEDLAYLDIQKIKNLYATLDHRDVKKIFDTDIQKNKEFYRYTQAIKLPSVIVEAKDIYAYVLEQDEANFITLKRTCATVVDLEMDNCCSGKIVCIKSADPGYDYLFSKNISGLITCYGGANSHMAIRCAELGIPAVIGCGENLFNQYKRAKVLTIDALNRQVQIIS